MAKSFLGLQKDGETMINERGAEGTSPETVISIIGPGMTVVGDCETDGTIRIDGKVEGTVRAGKAVVVGKDGLVEGDIRTQDAVVSGRVDGVLEAESRLELQSTCRIDGEIIARRMQLEEGAVVNGKVTMGDKVGGKGSSEPPALPPRAASSTSPSSTSKDASGGDGKGSGQSKLPAGASEKGDKAAKS